MKGLEVLLAGVTVENLEKSNYISEIEEAWMDDMTWVSDSDCCLLIDGARSEENYINFEIEFELDSDGVVEEVTIEITDIQFYGLGLILDSYITKPVIEKLMKIITWR